MTDKRPADSAPGPIARREIEHLLLGTDGTDESIAADEWARDIATALGARVTVVCAFDSPKAFRKRGSIYLAQARDELEAQAREIVAEVVADLIAAGIEATGVAFEGSTSDAVLRLAEDDPPDAIIISGRSPAGARDYLVGSAAERVVRHATVPVFVVK
jgi:nucleotide-binding universal stress UspA family protein